MQEISVISKEYARAPVGAPFNPTADVVKCAFVAVGATPGVSDWQTGIWETITPGGVIIMGTTLLTGQYFADCLVGPGGTIVLPAATWDMWVQISDSPEAIGKRAGQIRVY